jgi:hypothetical protein
MINAVVTEQDSFDHFNRVIEAFNSTIIKGDSKGVSNMLKYLGIVLKEVRMKFDIKGYGLPR